MEGTGEYDPNAHLEGAKAQFKHQPLLLAHVFRGEGEDGVVDAEERDEQEGGARQTPIYIYTHTRFNQTEVKSPLNPNSGLKDVMQEES